MTGENFADWDVHDDDRNFPAHVAYAVLHGEGSAAISSWVSRL
jgi:hypothetical protein